MADNNDTYAGVSTDKILHPTGVLYRNPSNFEAREAFDSQDQIVKAIKETGREKITEVFRFDEPNPAFLPGFVHIREMTPETATKLCQSLMRCRPNIIRLQIVLGEYPAARPLVGNGKVARSLNSSVARKLNDVAKGIADILTDKTIMAVSLDYAIHSAAPGAFSSSGTVFAASTEEEYYDNKAFNPVIVIEHFPTT